jgi:hypothetical protein
MKYYVLSDHLSNPEKFAEMLSFIKINFIIDSGGGNMHHARVIADIVNSEKDRFVLTGISLYSAAFYLFKIAQCKKKLAFGCIGMFHYPYIRMEITSNDRPYYNQDVTHRLNDKETYKKHIREFVSEFMNEKELRQLEQDDVFFTYKRLKKIFPEAEVV